MFYTASARKRTAQSSTRGLSRSPWSAKQSKSNIFDEVSYANDTDSSSKIKQLKEKSLLERFLTRWYLIVSFLKAKATRKQEESIEPHSMAGKKEKENDPEDIVREERQRIDEIRGLIDAEDFNGALKSLLADTDGDLHYFNKVKREMMSKQHDEAFRRRHGKLKCSLEEPELADERVCLWQGESDRGFPLRCHNKCLNHPHETTTNHRGVLCPRPLDFCSYHVRYCVETINHGDMPIKIRIPNEHALCNECYVLRTTARPPILDRIPGTRRKR